MKECDKEKKKDKAVGGIVLKPQFPYCTDPPEAIIPLDKLNQQTKILEAAGDYLDTINHAVNAMKKHGIPPTNIWVSPPETKEEKYQDKTDWSFLIHAQEYDSHPLIRIIDGLIIVFGCIIDFLADLGNRFVERKIKKKYMRKRK